MNVSNMFIGVSTIVLFSVVNHAGRLVRSSPPPSSNDSTIALAKKLKPSRRNYFPMVKLLKLFAAILVPLMIGAFTVVTTVQESNSSRYQRESDATRMERQRKLQEDFEQRKEVADTIKLHEEQEYSDRAAKELRMQNVFDTFVRDMNIVVLKPNENLTKSELLYARSRTFAVLEQVDVKRRWQIIKYLYDNQLLYVRDMGYKYIDLGGADLSNIRFGTISRLDQQTTLEKIRLSNVDLTNSSFINTLLRLSRFDFSDLSDTTFNRASFVEVNFWNATMENVDFYLTHLENVSFHRSNLKRTTWRMKISSRIPTATHIDFEGADLSESTFSGIQLTPTVRFQNTLLDRIRFNDMRFGLGLKFKDVSLKMAIFHGIYFESVEFHNSDLSAAMFSNCSFRYIRFSHVDLRNSQFNPVPGESKIDFDSVNLNGSNLQAPYKNYLNFSNSILPNGTFRTTFRSFDVNLLKNHGAEEDGCPESHRGNSTRRQTPIGWQSDGNINQRHYNTSSWSIEDVQEEWGSCFFYAGSRPGGGSVVLRQQFNVSELAVLIKIGQVRYIASGYLGGIGNETSTTTMKLIFRTDGASTSSIAVGQIDEKDRRGRTTLIYRQHNNIIPTGTTSIILELTFGRAKSPPHGHLGIADQLSLIIRRR